LLEAIAKSNTINIPQQKQQQEKPQPPKETTLNQQKQQQPAKNKSNNEAQKTQKTVKNENKDKEPSNRNKKENKTSKVDLELLTRMSALFGEKNYAELIDLFEKDVLNINKPSQLKSVPDSYLSLVTCSLLFMVINL
jgi:chemotaxis protein histidine kinase CheA